MAQFQSDLLLSDTGFGSDLAWLVDCFIQSKLRVASDTEVRLLWSGQACWHNSLGPKMKEVYERNTCEGTGQVRHVA